MRLILFLSLVTLSVLVGCQRDKMNSKDLTTVNVKRSLPASLPETGTPRNQGTTVGTSPRSDTNPNQAIFISPNLKLRREHGTNIKTPPEVTTSSRLVTLEELARATWPN